MMAMMLVLESYQDLRALTNAEARGPRAMIDKIKFPSNTHAS